MKSQTTTSILSIAAALMLVSCASRGPASSAEVAAANARTRADTGSEYKSLVDNASDQIVCRRQMVTGSRIPSQVCLTRADMEAQRERAEEVMRDMRSSAAIAQPIPDRPAMPSSPQPGRP